MRFFGRSFLVAIVSLPDLIVKKKFCIKSLRQKFTRSTLLKVIFNFYTTVS